LQYAIPARTTHAGATVELTEKEQWTDVAIGAGALLLVLLASVLVLLVDEGSRAASPPLPEEYLVDR
jgi:hypothetical protein